MPATAFIVCLRRRCVLANVVLPAWQQSRNVCIATYISMVDGATDVCHSWVQDIARRMRMMGCVSYGRYETRICKSEAHLPRSLESSACRIARLYALYGNCLCGWGRQMV